MQRDFRRRREQEQRMPAEGIVRGTMSGAQPLPAETRPTLDGRAEEAYLLGEQMGARMLAQEAGVQPAQGTGTGRTGGMTRERVIEAGRILMEYKGAKSSVDNRIVSAQIWWKLKNWEMIQMERGTQGSTEKKSSTGWLWSSIVGKHADAIDSYPEPVILPRMADDKDEAKSLSDIVPVVMELNDFEEVYNDAQWQKLQEGTAGYGIFWDKSKMGGIGDISIKQINILNLFWEPGIKDIQESRNVFYVYLKDIDEIEEQYPETRGKITDSGTLTAEYRTDDTIPRQNKAAVVDWYYHLWNGGKKELHLCTFCGSEILYSTENEGTTLYDDGEYPFVLDPLYPVEGSPAGYGIIDVAKDNQMDIDEMSQAMVQNTKVVSTPRFFISGDGSINEEEFADFSKPFVHSKGQLDERHLQQIQVSALPANAITMYQQKIDELKFVTGNTDVNNGGVPSGVTAASAIAALKEDSGRTSKDSTKAAYRSYRKIVTMVIERIRQFYDIPRQFRIVGDSGQERFVSYSNKGLRPQVMMGGLGMAEAMRKPVFDIEVRAQRENAYTKMSQNELAIQFMQLGMFNPQMADQAIMALDMMDFKGKDELKQKIQQQGTLLQALANVGQIALQLAAQYNPAVAEQLAPMLQGIIGQTTGIPAAGGMQSGINMGAPADAVNGPGMKENPIVQRAREQAANASRPS